MNQIVHIFRKDCRRLWQIIAAVLVFTFLHGYGDATNLSGRAIGLSPRARLDLDIAQRAHLVGFVLPSGCLRHPGREPGGQRKVLAHPSL